MHALAPIRRACRLYVVLSVAGSSVTLTTNLVAGVAVGSRFYNFGIETDTDVVTGEPHEVYDLEASAESVYYNDSVGIIASHRPDEPLLISIDNLTNPGAIDWAAWAYGQPTQVLASTVDPGAVLVM